ncbi:hypothetical protein CCO03_08665 [Comamonas serinivorans]|uniref:HicB family protein n=1 Tax=Comamonas serinivorans TaxID=1082851 RepID=A0A1Y0EN57_9BURK|nr:type II toxin-antitoxin system HicB family antitoxin [Comamonas serinivorans]ARU04739.1 hypothetical protein CCO03_08665 [Comamonas serinivorans]
MKFFDEYPAHFSLEDGIYVVTFRDWPAAITQGDSKEEAREMAADVLALAMNEAISKREMPPEPSKPIKGEEMVRVAFLVRVKLDLIAKMQEQLVRPADLAKLIHVKPQEMTRVLNLTHATKVDTLDRAFAALGWSLQHSLKKC